MSKPKIGFLGTGWIGRHRMAAALATGVVEAVAIADPSDAALAEAALLAPAAQRVATLDDMLALQLDGLVIATPSAMHAEQTIAALRAGVAVFCQKPLGRTEAEVARAIEAARRADRLLCVDFSYRFTEAATRIRDLVRDDELGRVFAADLMFHNAYGPDKPWFYERRLSGGGCMTDLGIHLVDLALWLLDFPAVSDVSSALYAGGAPLERNAEQVEDYGIATIALEGGAAVRIACSWKLHAGQDAVISAEVFGTKGGAALRNVGGSFYDFEAERFRGTARERLVVPPDAWGGRAIADWARRLAAGERFSVESERFTAVHRTLDRIYERRT